MELATQLLILNNWSRSAALKDVEMLPAALRAGVVQFILLNRYAYA